MQLSQKLQDWYQKNKRPLPWRRDRSAYFIWISEIMLQQTTVNVVIPYFERFIAEFPTIEALAKAPTEKVMSLWSGLGYYSRARNLQKAAQTIVKRGRPPGNYGDWLELSGVGPYTAAAIASQAHGEEVAAIDGNVIRVISRLFDVPLDVGTAPGLEAIKAYATTLISGLPPGEHNQAMMELGATICTPKSPACLLCPVEKFCKARKNGTIELRPVKKKKRRQEPWLWEIFVIEDNGRVALVNAENGTPWLKNTWVLPGRATRWTEPRLPASDLRHSITHHKIFVQIKKVKSFKLNPKNTKWIKPSDLNKVGVSSIVQKIIRSTHFEK